MRTHRLFLAGLIASVAAGSAWAQSATGGAAGSASGAGNYGISGNYGGATAGVGISGTGSSSGIGLGGVSIGEAGASAYWRVRARWSARRVRRSSAQDRCTVARSSGVMGPSCGSAAPPTSVATT